MILPRRGVCFHFTAKLPNCPAPALSVVFLYCVFFSSSHNGIPPVVDNNDTAGRQTLAASRDRLINDIGGQGSNCSRRHQQSSARRPATPHSSFPVPTAPNVVWFCTCAPQTNTDRQEQAFVSRRRTHAKHQSRTHQGPKATGTDALHKQGGKGLSCFSGLLQIAMHTLYIVPYINSKCAKAGKWQHTPI